MIFIWRDHKKMTFRKFLNSRVYFSAFVLLAVMAAGLYLTTDSTTVSAQRGDRASRGETTKGEVARADMLAFALNMRSANDQTVFGQKGVRGDAASVSGKVSTGSDANLAGGLSGMKVRSDLTKSFSAINQLPCIDLEGELTGGSFTPGVYCAPSANLAGDLTLEGEGIYVFRIDGAFKTTETFGMTMNGAKSGSVYFVAGDTASIAANSTIEGTIIARNTVDIGAGTTVKGRALSVDSEVILGASSNLVLATGVIEICKEAFRAEDLNAPNAVGSPWNGTLANRIWGFQVNGVVYTAPTGGCTGPIVIADNTPTTIEEQIDGTFTDRAGTWSNRFRLVSVTRTQGPGTVSNVNLPARTAQVTVPDTNGDIAQQTVVVFTNTFAFPAVIEICKRALDLDVTGFFDFTVDVIVGQVFTVPVGQCSGALQVLVPWPPPTSTPATGLVVVTELGRAGFQFESATTFPAGRLGFVSVNSGVTNSNACAVRPNPNNVAGCTFSNPGGGWVGAVVVEGGTSNQTTVNFFNRSNPGVIKVCKIAGPGVPIGAEFDFVVQGNIGDPTPPQPSAVVYDSVPAPLAPNYASLGFQATQTSQFGDYVNLAGTNRVLDEVTFTMSTWAYQSEAANVAYCGANPGLCSAAGWEHDFTVNIYNIGAGAVGTRSVGSLIASVTQTQTVPWRPEPSAPCGTAWQAADTLCYNGFAFNMTFDMSSLAATLPDDVVVGIAYNTQTYGTAPMGVGGPFNSLNVAIPTGNAPSVGTDDSLDRLFWNTSFAPFYTDGGAAGVGVFREDTAWTPNGNVAMQITATGAAVTSGTIQNRRVRVLAGPNNLNGGFCEFVRNDDGSLTRFVVGTNVYVREYDYIEGTGQTPIVLPADGSIRVGRIRMEQGAGAFAAAGTNVGPEAAGVPPSAFAGYDPPAVTPNPRLGPIDNNVVPSSAGGFGDAVFMARRGTREIEYVNFVFRPTALKICKIAGAGVIEGTPYTFSVVIDNLGGLINHFGTGGPAVANVTVQAGPAATGGFCAFAEGPAGPNPGGPNPFYGNIFTNPSVAAFPAGFNVTVTETGGNVTAVTSPTGSVSGILTGANGAGTLLLAHPSGFNEIVFTNGTAAPVQTAFSISGRVMTPEGGGLRNAQVVLTKADGSKISVPTSSMGYYSFDGLANETYNLGVSSRRYRFQSREVELNSSLADVNFTGIE